VITSNQQFGGRGVQLEEKLHMGYANKRFNATGQENGENLDVPQPYGTQRLVAVIALSFQFAPN
jgi:hypothetical protein